MALSGRTWWLPTDRSKITAVGTMGTRVTVTSKPRPCSSRNSMTPPAASRPKALPPVIRTPWTSVTRCVFHQGVHLAGARRGAPDIDAAHRARRAEDHGAAGDVLEVTDMAHLESREPW